MLKRILFVMLFSMVLAGCTTVDMKPYDARLDAHESRISALESRVDALEQKDSMQQERATEVSRTFQRSLQKGM